MDTAKTNGEIEIMSEEERLRQEAEFDKIVEEDRRKGYGSGLEDLELSSGVAGEIITVTSYVNCW